MMGFLLLRLDSHAQYEAREYAQAIYDLLSSKLPETMKWLDQFQEKESTNVSTPCRGWLWRFFNTGV